MLRSEVPGEQVAHRVGGSSPSLRGGFLAALGGDMAEEPLDLWSEAEWWMVYKMGRA